MNYPAEFISYCEDLKLRLTSLRKEILHILWRADKPVKAYEILNDLLKIKPNATPPSIYRSLDFFVLSGILHKIESIQSYTLCNEPIKNLPAEILMVCNVCHSVIETYNNHLHELFTKLSSTHYFELNQDAIELKGTCKNCSL
jgi:Fur family transcriptional regulator, zinc uptake regulator